jgi:hypothetical protein
VNWRAMKPESAGLSNRVLRKKSNNQLHLYRRVVLGILFLKIKSLLTNILLDKCYFICEKGECECGSTKKKERR